MIRNRIVINSPPSPGVPAPEFTLIKSGTFRFVEQVCQEGLGIRYGGAFTSYIEGEAYYKPDGTPEIVDGDILHYWQITDRWEDLSDYQMTRNLKIGDFVVKKCERSKYSYTWIAYEIQMDLLSLDVSPFLKQWMQYEYENLDIFLDQLARYINIETNGDCTVNVSELDVYSASGSIKCFFVDGITARDVLSYFAEISFQYLYFDGIAVHFRRFSTTAPNFNWINSDQFIIAPTDQATYTGTAIINGVPQTVNLVPVYYKESGLTKEDYTFVVPSTLRATKINGDTDTYSVLPDTENVYNIQNNIVYENNRFTNGLTDTAVPGFTALRTLLTDYPVTPFTVKLFPFYNPFRAGQILAHIEGSDGVRFSSVIVKMELTDSEVILTCSGQEYYYDSTSHNYDLNSDSNALFAKINEYENSLAGKVSKSGDSMSGDLIIESQNLEDGTTVQNETIGKYLRFDDANGKRIGFVMPVFSGNYSGYQFVALESRRVINGSNIDNYIRLGADSSGNLLVRLSSAAIPQWLNQFGLGTSGALPITIAQGGTGNTQVESTSTVSDIATAGSNCTISNANFASWGKLAQIRIRVSCTQSFTTSKIFAVVKTDKLPVIAVPVQSSDGTLKGFIDATNGNVQMYGSYTANTNVVLLATYLLA